MNYQTKSYLGLGKTLYHSSVCHVNKSLNGLDVELLLTERLTKKKADGRWPHNALEEIKKKLQANCLIAENRDVISSVEYEKVLNLEFPFFEFLEKKELEQFSLHYNKNITELTHHLCHAYSALAMSPFKEGIIIVMDGAGSELEKNQHEEYSAYYFKDFVLEKIDQRLQQFVHGKNRNKERFTSGAGLFYEDIAKYIFNSNQATGKVMGLSSFGEGENVSDPQGFLDNLDMSKSFKGKGKTQWEESPNLKLYKNLATTAQNFYQDIISQRVHNIKKKYPKVDNLIITGGCALNCVSNWDILKSKIFSNVYIPSIPDDRGISFGLSSYLMIKDNLIPEVTPYKDQQTYWGLKSSVPNEPAIKDIFRGYKITKPSNIIKFTAEKINQNKIIGWFQGRSEVGARALGNRSIVAKVNYPNLKDTLNSRIKFRESFRPYACSVLQDKVSLYFQVQDSFQSPYMSFTVPIKSSYLETFKEVCHIDHTSRLQTVMREQNTNYYDLIKEVGNISGIYALLNTSLNIMGQPIVEDLNDLKLFFDKSNVDAIAVGDFYIEK